MNIYVYDIMTQGEGSEDLLFILDILHHISLHCL